MPNLDSCAYADLWHACVRNASYPSQTTTGMYTIVHECAAHHIMCAAMHVNASHQSELLMHMPENEMPSLRALHVASRVQPRMSMPLINLIC